MFFPHNILLGRRSTCSFSDPSRHRFLYHIAILVSPSFKNGLSIIFSLMSSISSPDFQFEISTVTQVL